MTPGRAPPPSSAVGAQNARGAGHPPPCVARGGPPRGGWVGARLHRRLFVGFASAIVATAAVAWAAVALTSDGPRRWHAEVVRAEGFAGRRFGEVWADPRAREALADAIARDFGVQVSLRDERGSLLSRHPGASPPGGTARPADDPAPPTPPDAPVAPPGGAAHAAGPPDDARCARGLVFPALVGARRVGEVRICDGRALPHRPLATTLLALASAVAVLWLLAGVVARRLARPLRELTEVTRDLGAGRLEARARLHADAPGEVGELARSVNDMAERIERQLGAQRQLLADVSHEMRTPLSRMRLLVEIARDGLSTSGGDPASPAGAASRTGMASPAGAADADRSSRARLLDDLEREIVDLDALVGALLAGARIDAGALSPRTLDVAEVLDAAWRRAGLGGPPPEVAPGAERVDADATLLARALGALLDNARRHGAGAVTLRAERRGDRVAFVVEDEGPGFADGEEVRVFEPFVRGRGAPHDEARGVGLGLALVRRVAEAHGGTARAETRPEGGARVWLELPVRASRA